MTATLTIDGSQGEGGGQIIRSSLTLSLLTGTPFTIDKIRAGRSKPGLMRQHLTAVLAAQQVGRAQVEGAAIGSQRLSFYPSGITAGDFHFRVGTAGSTTLVLQTILAALALADGPSHVTLEGGTHNPFAPPFDHLTNAYLPALAAMGPQVTARLERPGFYPAGGGRLVVDVIPVASLGPLDLLVRGKLRRQSARILVANLPRRVAERERRTLARRLNWSINDLAIEEVTDSAGPGNVILAEVRYANVCEVITGFGQKGVSAENVAARVAKAVREYLKHDAPVGEYLADQLMLPLGIGAQQGSGGGSFRTQTLSKHAQTHVSVLGQFLPEIRIETVRQDKHDWLVQIRPQ